MLQQRICQEPSCGRSFEGGPRAYYCPSCRTVRAKQAKAEYLRRKKSGEVRPIGSTDKCDRCGSEYTVEGGNQRFCPECQPIHATEYDRETAIDYYHANKERINPVRNERRRIEPTRPCKVCGKEFEHGGTVTQTCSKECARIRINQWQAAYRPIFEARNKERLRVKRAKREKYVRMLRGVFGLCPHCGREWTQPRILRGLQPNYCRKCQDYYLERNRRSKQNE